MTQNTDRLSKHTTTFVWASMTGLMYAYIWKYARNVPFMEDWDLVPTLTGASPFSLAWLAEQTGEHRYILGKALLYPLWQLTYDARSSMVVSAALMSVIALALMIVARRLRGKTSLVDVFFPIALLHPGHCETLIFFVQLWFVLPILFFVCVLVLIVTRAWESSRLAAFALAACVALLPLNGAIGLLLALPLVVWMAWTVVTKRRPAIFAVSAIATVVLGGLYFLRYETSLTFVPIARTVRGTLRTLVEVCSVGLGPGGAWLWPWAGLAIGTALGITGIALAVIAWRNSEDRCRVAGLFACLAGVGLLIAGITWGRTVIGPGSGIPSRYALLVAPGLCIAFLGSIVYGRKLVAGRLVQIALATCAAGLLWPNVEVAREYGRLRAAAADGTTERLAAGAPSSVVARRYAKDLYPNVDPLALRLDMLRAQGSGPFRGMVDVDAKRPCRDELEVVKYVDVSGGTFVDGRMECRSADGFVVYSLPSPRDVCTVTVVYAFEKSAAAEASMQLYWCLDGTNGFEEARRNQTIRVDASPDERAVTFDVYDRLDRLRFDPDLLPCTLRIVRIEVSSRAVDE